MPSLIAAGSFADTANSVVNPAILTPTLPGTRTNGDRLMCFTFCTSATATVALSAGWQSLWNAAGSAGRVAGFTCLVTGSETAPTVTWTGTTTGTSGTPCVAIVINIGTGLLETGGLLTVDATSAFSDDTTSGVQAGGAAFYTVTPDAWIFAHGVRRDSSLSSVATAGGAPVSPWINMVAATTTSGAGMAYFLAMGAGPTLSGDLVTEHSWSLTGAIAVASSGLMVAIQTPPVPSEPGELKFTRGRR